MRINHEIFHRPNNVKLTFEDLPPEPSYRTRASGKKLGDTMPMWRVQTEGYKDERGMLVGVVTPGKILEISPDGEFISGGVNSKGVDSVALGRQGNYFHWGFAASPTYMTDEAKLVLVNAVHYISKFKGQRAFVKKRVNVTRSSLDDMYFTLSDEGFSKWQNMLGELRKSFEESKQSLQKRKDDGEELSATEEMSLRAPPMKEYTRFDLTDFPETLKKEFGENWDQYEKYYRTNYDFLFCAEDESGGRSCLKLDEDAKKLGIANYKIEILDRCIQLLVSGDESEQKLSRRVLRRYTVEDFETAAQWKDWLGRYRDYLFFSEVSGFKFIVDLNRIPDALKTDSSEASATTAQLKREKIPASKAELKSLIDAVEVENASQREPAKFSSVLKRIKTAHGIRARLIVKAKIFDGWHLYAHVPKDEPYVQTQIEVSELKGLKEAGKWKLSASTPDRLMPNILIWENEAVLTRDFEFSNEKDARVTITIRFQTCDKDRCLPPSEKTIEVLLKD